MKTLRLPRRSESAPTKTVVSVAATAEAATIVEIAPAEAWNIL